MQLKKEVVIMPVIRLETYINASPERCFDLSLNVDVHRKSSAHTGERAVSGVTSGQMVLGDTVTWEAVHFGIKQRLTSKITEYYRPYCFTDEMIQGVFKKIRHEHVFVARAAGTLMIDIFVFHPPLGPLGWLADQLVLTRYMRNLLIIRNAYIKQLAENTSVNLPF
jgi:ligand-binding SRPBCC domain-containing protein